MWWFDVHTFNLNDPTTFGHIHDGKDDMMLTYADIVRAHQMFLTKNRVTALQGQIAEGKKLNEKLNESLELELSTLRKLESEDKAAEDRRAKEKQQREMKEKIERDPAIARATWPGFTAYEKEILQVLEQDKTGTDRLNALNALHGGKPAPYRHTLRTAYDTVIARHAPYKFPPFIYRPGYAPKDVLPPAPSLVDVTQIGTPVRYTPEGWTGIVIPCPYDKQYRSIITGQPFIYLLNEKNGRVFGAYKQHVQAV